MNKSTKAVSSDEMVQIIANAMQDKKATKIAILDLKEIPEAITDYFVVCTGSSHTQLDAIAEAVEDAIYETYRQRPRHYEKQNGQEWILQDYFEVVVHIFSEGKRDFYGLEKLWGDAKITLLKDA